MYSRKWQLFLAMARFNVLRFKYFVVFFNFILKVCVIYHVIHKPIGIHCTGTGCLE